MNFFSFAFNKATKEMKSIKDLTANDISKTSFI